MELNDIYKVILANAGMVADDEGFISMVDQNEPVLLSGKRLVLPVRNQLAQPNLGNRVVFHPLHESLIRGETDIMTRTREMINARLNISFSYITLCLLTLATSPAQHVNLTPDQTLFMDNLKDIDEDIVEAYSKILEAMSVSQDGKCFMRFFIKRGGEIGGRTVQRLAVVSFPFYEELLKRPATGQPNMIYGVRVKKAHRECLIKLVEYMVPNIAIAGHYNRGSDSTVAPTLDAVMQATRSLGGLVNEMTELFGETVIPDRDSMQYPMDWVSTFENLSAIQAKINLVPAQPGNEGKLPGSDRPKIEVPGSIVKPALNQAPWDGENTLSTSQAPATVKQVEAPAVAEDRSNDTIFGPRPTAPARPQPVVQRPAYGMPANVVHNAPLTVQQPIQQNAGMARVGATPGVIGQSLNKFLPNYVEPVQQMGYGYGAHPFAGQQLQPQQRPPHVPIWGRSGGPGYSNGYGNNGNNGGGFAGI